MNYFKVNKKVAEHLGLTQDRNKTADGAYIIWVADLSRLGNIGNKNAILADIGGIELTPKETLHSELDEIKGITNTPLPQPQDERFGVVRITSDTDTGTQGTQGTETNITEGEE